MLKNKLSVVLSLVIVSAILAKLSLAQAQAKYYHAQYIKVYCVQNAQTNLIDLVANDPQDQSHDTESFANMNLCRQYLDLLDKNYCATTQSCSIVNSDTNTKL